MLDMKTLSALAAVAALALPAAATAQEMGPVKVEGRAPTTVRIDLAGKSHGDVKREVRVAARTVCANAVFNHELAFFDVDWCTGATQVRALSRYAKIVRHNASLLASGYQITLAAR